MNTITRCTALAVPVMLPLLPVASYAAPADPAVEAYRATDARFRMSVHRRIPDVAQRGAEGRFMTQSVNREFFGMDRFGLGQPSLSWSRNHPKPDIALGDHRLAGIAPRQLCPERVLGRQS